MVAANAPVVYSSRPAFWCKLKTFFCKILLQISCFFSFFSFFAQKMLIKIYNICLFSFIPLSTSHYLSLQLLTFFSFLSFLPKLLSIALCLFLCLFICLCLSVCLSVCLSSIHVLYFLLHASYFCSTWMTSCVYLKK